MGSHLHPESAELIRNLYEFRLYYFIGRIEGLEKKGCGWKFPKKKPTEEERREHEKERKGNSWVGDHLWDSVQGYKEGNIRV